MKLLRNYLGFLYRRLWDAGKFGSLNEANFQMLPWIGATLILMLICSDSLDFAPNSYPNIVLTIVVMSPFFIGMFIIFGVQFRVARDRKKRNSIEKEDNG